MGQLLFDCRLIFQVLVFRCISWAGGLALKVESSQSNPLIEFPKTYPKLWTQLSGVKDMVNFAIFIIVAITIMLFTIFHILTVKTLPSFCPLSVFLLAGSPWRYKSRCHGHQASGWQWWFAVFLFLFQRHQLTRWRWWTTMCQPCLMCCPEYGAKVGVGHW